MLESNRFCGSCGSVLTPKPEVSMADTMAMVMPRTPTVRTASSQSSARSSPSSVSFDEGRFLPGTLVAERYRIIGILGRGGMGEVYRATDLVLGQQVGLKFLPEAAAADPDILERFHGEVRIARQVSHPNVCRVYDIGMVAGQPYISMEYVDGEDLGSLLRRIGRLPNDKAVEMARKLCAGLAAAHDKGVLHRDLKPANVMVDGRGQLLIMDFGLAGLASQIQGNEIRHGTPAYMAPEQLSGKEVSIRSDIYSLGLVLYEMFTGKRAFEAASLAEMTRLRQESSPPSLVSLVRDLDPAVERVVMRCLSADPQNRPASALAVSAALPGGDPLAAALAAGETPSPELVAAASEREALKPPVALACLLGILASLAAIPFLVSQSAWITKTPFENSPEALAQKSRDLIQHFGYTSKPTDSAFRLYYNTDFTTDLERKGKSSSALTHLNTGQPAPIIFWYRTSPRYLIASSFGNDGEVTSDDPAMEISGMVKIEVDAQGRLLGFDAVPPQVDETPVSGAKPLDPVTLLSAAGLDPARFQTVEPKWTPLAVVDQRAAWTGTYPDDPNPLRVEAAAWRGKLVYFSLVSPWTRPSRMQPVQLTPREKIGQVVGLSLICAIVIGACLLARHNIHLGKADWRSAFRLSGFFLVLTFADWALSTHHVPALTELIIILMGLSTTLLSAGLMWIMYVALEPFVRRHWPQTIISWTRILAGRLHDAVVGGHVLVGMLYGIFLSVLVHILEATKFHATGVPTHVVILSTVLSVPKVVGTLLGALPNSILNTLGVFFLLFLLRVIFRREWLAATAFVVILTAIATLLSQADIAVALPIRMLQYSMTIFVMLRFGLLSFVVGQCMVNILLLFPITADFSAWYAGSTIFTIAVIVALAGYAFHTALAGRPLFQTKLLDD
jgi:serine/threonine protein kinase